MLFDLKGRRKRAVQATYLALAILMGGGLVGFGIGGNVGGGLLDAFKGGGGGSSGNELVKKRIERAEKRARANPRDERPLKQIARDYYQLVSPTVDQTGKFPSDAHDDLRKAAAAWQRYLALRPARPDPSLARLMLQVYGELGLNQPAQAAQVAEIVADSTPTAQAYLNLTRYAALAHQKRKADLAGRRAIELAPRSQRSTVMDLVKQAKAASAQPAGGGGGSP